MDKKDLVIKVAKKSGVSEAVARRAVNAFTDAVVVGAKQSGTVKLAGLGKIAVTPSKASRGRIEAKRRRIKSKKRSITLIPSELLKWHVRSIVVPDRYKTPPKVKVKSAGQGRI